MLRHEPDADVRRRGRSVQRRHGDSARVTAVVVADGTAAEVRRRELERAELGRDTAGVPGDAEPRDGDPGRDQPRGEGEPPRPHGKSVSS